MDSVPRHESFLSEGLECVLPTLRSSDLDAYLKQENFLNIDAVEERSRGENDFNLHQDEVTEFSLDIPDSTEIQYIVPCPTSRLPAREDYPGIHQFDVDLKKPNAEKAKWEYSESLNKLFVVMYCKVPLKIKWSQGEYGLFVRALPIFLEQDSLAEPVRRCASHVSVWEKSNKGFAHVEHVIRCEHPHAKYDKNPESERLSVVVPLDRPQPGSDGTTIVYSFMCKNSCSVGMNRRNTGLIFTLERESGEVVGRKVVNVRICSCPRRDRMKEETDASKNANCTLTQMELPKFIPGDKKALKRSSKDVVLLQVNLPKRCVQSAAKIVREAVLLGRESDLTAEDKVAIEECNRYITE